MSELSNTALLILLMGLLICSAFFSSSETGMMSLNRYRLKHLVRQKNKAAIRVQNMLEKPERLLGLILIGNNFVNLFAAAVATILAVRLYGEAGVAIATAILTFVVLIFAEVTPKTWAAWYPQRIAFFASWILRPLLIICYPLVFVVNAFTSWLLRLLGVNPDEEKGEHLSQDELRTIVVEAGTMIPSQHQSMLLGILDLEQATVDDIMIPRNEVEGVDLDDSWEDIVEQIQSANHSKAVVYSENWDNVVGVLSLRKALHLLICGELSKEKLLSILSDPYFVPEGTHLHRQLKNFQQRKEYFALVVDEYGDFEGIVTLADILDEIVGFESDESAKPRKIQPQDDGSVIVEGSLAIRDLNRTMQWHLPTKGPSTLNGMVIEYMEAIPTPGRKLKVSGHMVEVIDVKDNQVKVLRIMPIDSNE